MTPYKAVVFDLDGTLCDTRVDLANAVNHARGRLGFGPLSTQEITRYVGDGMTKLLERAFHGRCELVAPARPHFNAFYAEHLTDNSPLYDGVAESLRALADAATPMAVLTNKPEGFSRALLQHHGLAELLLRVVGGDTLATRKPEPEGALAIMQALGASPSETLMVGDNYTDLLTARLAGMPSVFCTYGFGRRRDQDYDFSAGSFADVVRIFRYGP